MVLIAVDEDVADDARAGQFVAQKVVEADVISVGVSGALELSVQDG
jgi:hypothetical protein